MPHLAKVCGRRDLQSLRRHRATYMVKRSLAQSAYTAESLFLDPWVRPRGFELVGNHNEDALVVERGGLSGHLTELLAMPALGK